MGRPRGAATSPGSLFGNPPLLWVLQVTTRRHPRRRANEARGRKPDGMRFLAITLIVHSPDPVTGTPKSTVDRFREVIDNALLAEDLGFDGFGVGERHEWPFISSSPPVVLSHIAAL